MNKSKTRHKWVFVFASTAIIATVVSAGVFSAKKQMTSNTQQRRVDYMPPVISKIKKLQIVRTWIQDPGTPHAGVAIEVKNNSNLAVMAVDLVSGEGGVTTNGLTDEEHPIVVIEPHGSTKLFMNFGSMAYGEPLVIAAVTYADGKEEGDEASLKAMHQVRVHDRARIKAEKERHVQKGGGTREKP